MYHDAYTIQLVEDRHLITFNFVGGMVPFLLNLILDVSRHCPLCLLIFLVIFPAASCLSTNTQFHVQRKEGKILNAKKAHKITVALEEIKDFMIIKGVATKERQKLMRNLRVSE